MEIVISDSCKTKIFAYILFLFMSAFGTTILSLQYRDQGARLRIGGNLRVSTVGAGGGGWGLDIAGNLSFRKFWNLLGSLTRVEMHIKLLSSSSDNALI